MTFFFYHQSHFLSRESSVQNCLCNQWSTTAPTVLVSALEMAPKNAAISHWKEEVRLLYLCSKKIQDCSEEWARLPFGQFLNSSSTFIRAVQMVCWLSGTINSRSSSLTPAYLWHLFWKKCHFHEFFQGIYRSRRSCIFQRLPNSPLRYHKRLNMPHSWEVDIFFNPDWFQICLILCEDRPRVTQRNKKRNHAPENILWKLFPSPIKRHFDVMQISRWHCMLIMLS